MDNISQREPPQKLRFSLSALGRHVIFLAVALALTLVVFEFWGQFGHAMGTVLGIPRKHPWILAISHPVFLPSPLGD